MAFCTNCGKPLTPGQKFCTNCGTKVPVAMATTPPPPPPPRPSPQPSPIMGRGTTRMALPIHGGDVRQDREGPPPPPPAAPRVAPPPPPVQKATPPPPPIQQATPPPPPTQKAALPPPVAPSFGVKTVAKAASSVTSMARSFDIMASNQKGEWVASTWQPTLPASSTSLTTKVKNFFIPQRKLAYAWFLLPVLTTVFTIVSYVVHVVGRLFS